MDSPVIARRVFFILLTLLLLMAGTVAAALMRPQVPRDITHDVAVREVPIGRDSGLKDRGPVPPFSIEGLSDGDLKGEARVVVLFASWCTPCLAEHPVIMELSKSVPVYGVDVTDKPDGLQNYLKHDGNPYRKIGIDNTGDVSISLGAEGLPTSFIINADGHIVWRHDGPMTLDEARNVVIPLMKKLP
jgi:cytochrome c biogenesis protein CcmG/thiol:disulfide interchange protein DsbE